jgi:hypothetical protein
MEMRIQRANYELDAEDRKVYAAWLRRMLVAYGATAIMILAVVAVQTATRATNVTEVATSTATPHAP